MKILGLTGSIGMGKSTAAAMLRRLGVPVHDADAVVHALMEPGGAAFAAVAAAFPQAVENGRISRPALGKLVFADESALRRLEGIVHPLVRAAETRFLKFHRRRRTALVVLDIPLLLETGGEKRCDAVAAVSAPAFLQALRVLRRPGMSPERLAAVRAKQMPDFEKRRRADFIIPSGAGRGPALRALRNCIARLLQRTKHA